MADFDGTSLSLLQRIRCGDSSSWQRLVDLYKPLICHWCLRWGVASGDIDDLAQEVFHAASQSIDYFRREQAGDTFRGWLRSIARHKVLSYWRSRHAQPEAFGGSEAMQQLQEMPAPTDADPEDAAQEASVFRRAIEMLRGEFETRTWQAFWRMTIDGQSASEIAKELEMSPSAIRMAKSRVLRRLREELGDILE